MYAKAIYVDGRIVTGRHHGEAFGMLSDKEKCSDTLLSGFYDESTGRFFYDDQSFYTKSIYLVRHSRPSKGYDEDQDPDLSQEGVEKAHKLATFLMDAGLKDYEGYTSPYLRCLITADIIARMTGIQFTVALRNRLRTTSFWRTTPRISLSSAGPPAMSLGSKRKTRPHIPPA
jgi:hypothetical protein